MKLVVATCQLPTSADLRRNTRYVLGQIQQAAEQGAQVAHFGEGALSGYAGADMASYNGFDWDLLRQCSEQVLASARENRIWVLVGSTHRLTGRRRPHNSVYVIDDRGGIRDRYDKRFCAGDQTGKTGELAHYSPGNHSSVFTIGGVRCGVLICHEYRYPELYRECERKGVQVVFHSYHAGHVSAKQLAKMRAGVGPENMGHSRGTTLPEITMPAAMQAAAASNHVWISCPNSSARESCWPAFFVRPDGVVTGRLRRHRSGVLVSTVDTELPLYDSTQAWRSRAMRGQLHSGKLVDDERSRDRRHF